MARSLHLIDSYLPRTETFIWQALRKLRRFPPLVLADRWEHEAEFPLPGAGFLKLGASRSLWPRLVARATGTFAPVRYAPGSGEEIRRAHDIAVCHVHKGFRALVTREFTRALGRPLIVNFYGSDVSQRAFLRRAAQGYRDLFRQARFLLVEGPAMRQRLLDLGAPGDKIREQRIAIDPAEYPFRERDWDGNRPVHILFVGRLVDKKGLETGLRALADPRVDFPWRLTVIGDGPLRPRLQALATRLGIGDHADFVGWRSLDETRAAMQRHDLLLQPSQAAPDGDGEGGAPTVLLEAQACGLPVIATTHDDIPHVTVPGESAWLAPEGDPAALAYLLRRAGEEADRWGVMGRAGRRKIEADHDINRTIGALEDLYAEAAERS
jgi:colanic acid/amylovoran biosynthesis glycosyltransferase